MTPTIQKRKHKTENISIHVNLEHTTFPEKEEEEERNQGSRSIKFNSNEMITTHYSPFDLLLLFLISAHLLFSFLASAFVLHFHFRSSSSSSPSPSLCRRLHLLLRLNSLWPVRLLLVLFASLLSFSELLRLPHRNPLLCQIYSISSQSFAEPAFFATLLFLLRASTDSKLSPSFASVFSSAMIASFPFLLLQFAYLFSAPWITKKMSLDPDLLLGPPSDRCSQTLFSTFLLAILGAVYVPLFISACWNAVTVVINKRLRVRLYALATVVVVALSGQLTSLALSSLWSASSVTGQLWRAIAFGLLLVCMGAGEGILVVQPVVDALEIVVPDGVEGWLV